MAVVVLSLIVLVGIALAIAQARAEDARMRIPLGPGEVDVWVKTYTRRLALEADANRMAEHGWVPQGMVGEQGKVRMGRTMVKGAAFLPWAVMRPSRRGTAYVMTWVRGG